MDLKHKYSINLVFLNRITIIVVEESLGREGNAGQ